MFTDYDVPKGMPDNLKFDTHAKWVSAIEKIIPGFGKAPKEITPSSSGRVRYKGQPYQAAGWHCFALIADPGNIRALKDDRFFINQAVAKGLAHVS